jgi:hypothetical protein
MARIAGINVPTEEITVLNLYFSLIWELVQIICT